MNQKEIIDRYFLEHRAKVLDVAAFLDRIDRCSDEETVQQIIENPYLQCFLGFKSYQQYLIAKKNGQLDQDEVIQEEEDNVKSDENSWYYIYWLSYVGWELFVGVE